MRGIQRSFQMNSHPFTEETEIKDWQDRKKLGWREENLQVVTAQVTHRLSSHLLTPFHKMWQKKHCKAKRAECVRQLKWNEGSAVLPKCQSAISFPKLEVKWARRNSRVEDGKEGMEKRKTPLGIPHPRKRVQGGKEDGRFVCKETSRGFNEGS